MYSQHVKKTLRVSCLITALATFCKMHEFLLPRLSGDFAPLLGECIQPIHQPNIALGAILGRVYA